MKLMIEAIANMKVERTGTDGALRDAARRIPHALVSGAVFAVSGQTLSSFFREAMTSKPKVSR